MSPVISNSSLRDVDNFSISSVFRIDLDDGEYGKPYSFKMAEMISEIAAIEFQKSNL
jgi:hypothetical protein